MLASLTKQRLLWIPHYHSWITIRLDYLQQVQQYHNHALDGINKSLVRKQRHLKCDRSSMHMPLFLNKITHFFFYKKLSSEMSTQFLSVSSTQFLRGFLSERDLRHFCTKTQIFLEKWLDSFLCTWNMSTRFLNSEKIWVLVSYKAVSYKKKYVYLTIYKQPDFTNCGFFLSD